VAAAIAYKEKVSEENTYGVIFSMKKTEFQPEIMTVSSLADYLHCHTSTIYRLLKERRIPAFKVGSDWRPRRTRSVPGRKRGSLLVKTSPKAMLVRMRRKEQPCRELVKQALARS